MQGMRDVLRGSLGRSLRSLSDEDRLAAAWPVACGPVLAARGEVVGLDAEGVLHVRVPQSGWREQFMQMRSALVQDLGRIAEVRLRAIHFEGQGTNRQSAQRGANATPGAQQTDAGSRKIVEKHS